MAPRRTLEAHFELFWALVAEWLPEGLWRLKMNSWHRFWWLLGTGHRNVQNEPLGAHSGQIEAQAVKELKISFLEPILAISRPRPPKRSK